MVIEEKNPTFGSRLREKRLAKGWSQHYLADQANCTNSNISYLETNPDQRPKIETVEALARALDWAVNEARLMAGYPESDMNVSRIEIEDEFRFALYGYKDLSENGRELAKKQIEMIIDLILEYEQRLFGLDNNEMIETPPDYLQTHAVPEITLDELYKRIGDRKKKGRKS